MLTSLSIALSKDIIHEIVLMSRPKNSFPCNFFNSLARLRKERNLTQVELQKMSGVPQQTIDRIESGNSQGTGPTLLKLARALNVTVDYLLTGQEPVTDIIPDHTFPVVATAGASARYGGCALPPGEKISLKNCVAIRVKDDSMEPVVRTGQFVLACPEREVVSGNLVVVDLDDVGQEGEWYFKRYYLTKEGKEHQFASVNTQLSLPTVVRTRRPRMYKVVGAVYEK